MRNFRWRYFKNSSGDLNMQLSILRNLTRTWIVKHESKYGVKKFEGKVTRIGQYYNRVLLFHVLLIDTHFITLQHWNFPCNNRLHVHLNPTTEKNNRWYLLASIPSCAQISISIKIRAQRSEQISLPLSWISCIRIYISEYYLNRAGRAS
jgi:hypothetical protein